MSYWQKEFSPVVRNAQRLIIDCSHAVRRGHRAGVQRVVWNLIEQSLREQSGLLHECTVGLRGRFHLYDPRQPPKSSRMREDIFAFLPTNYRSMAERIHRLLPTSIVQKMLLPRSGKLGIFRPWYMLQESRDRRLMLSDTQWREPGEGDVLLMADSYWCRPQVWPVVEAARRRGASVATIIYDLIPITHSHFVRPDARASFEAYLESAVTHSDMLVAISAAVQEECRSEIQRRWPERLQSLQLSHFRLGADLPTRRGPPSPQIEQLFNPSRSRTPYLMVSTFDPRKNHCYLLDAFELLWQQVPDAQLCLVGSRGWMSEEVLSRIEKHPRLNKQLFKFHALNDGDLTYCYEHARAVICPSIVEGFGLPVVEALAHGRKAFVSDIEVHREVGGGDCDYFCLTDPQALVHKLTQWERAVDLGASSARPVRSPTTWQSSAQDLFGQCAKLLERTSASETCESRFLKSA